MGYYSFVVFAQRPVGIPDPLILLDSGMNAFTATTDDLPGLLQLLESEGVTVTEYHKLDDHEPLDEASLLLSLDQEWGALAREDEEESDP